MDVPTWAYDDVLHLADPTPLRLALALYRHGTPLVDGNGQRRAHWRGSKAELARAVGCSKRAVDMAVIVLVEKGLIVKHNSTRENVGIALSAAVDRPQGGATVARGHEDHRATNAPPSEAAFTKGGATNAPPSDSKNAHMHVGVKHQPPDQDPDLPTMHASRARGATDAPPDGLRRRLKAAGVTDAEHWFASYAAPDIEAALDLAFEEPGIEKPGAFARYLLRSGLQASDDVPKSESPPAADAVPADIAMVLNSPAWQYRRESVNVLTRQRVDEWLTMHPHHHRRDE